MDLYGNKDHSHLTTLDESFPTSPGRHLDMSSNYNTHPHTLGDLPLDGSDLPEHGACVSYANMQLDSAVLPNYLQMKLPDFRFFSPMNSPTLSTMGSLPKVFHCSLSSTWVRSTMCQLLSILHRLRTCWNEQTHTLRLKIRPQQISNWPSAHWSNPSLIMQRPCLIWLFRHPNGTVSSAIGTSLTSPVKIIKKRNAFRGATTPLRKVWQTVHGTEASPRALLASWYTGQPVQMWSLSKEFLLPRWFATSWETNAPKSGILNERNKK